MGTDVTYRKSKQRERILQLLRETDVHPSVDWLYEKLKKEFPKLSLGTVYRNLSILVDQGLVKKIHFGSTYDRFDGRRAPHYHLICEACGKIEDLELAVYEEITRTAQTQSDFTITRHMIEFYGLCADCKHQ
ncbi:transcriptional repressor [bacterium]|nr:transcriptional repressor [bacterium]